jgi:hypothetical protein
MRSNYKKHLYHQLKQKVDVILDHEKSGQCIKSYLAFREVKKLFPKIVKIENAEAKRI